MDMETNFKTPEWLDKVIVVLEEKRKLLEKKRKRMSEENQSKKLKINDEDYYFRSVDYRECENSDGEEQHNVNNGNNNKIVYTPTYNKQIAKDDSRLVCMAPLFASHPRLEKIFRDSNSNLLSSCLTKYKYSRYENDSVDESHERANDLKCILNLCGTKLTCLDVNNYPISEIMPIINANCPSLKKLKLAFKEIVSQDFENAFSNMSNIQELSIEWQCENSTLPMTLAQSLEQIGGTLIDLNLSCTLKGNDIFSPDILASVFPRLVALTDLYICGFGLSQLLIQSISEMSNLTELILTFGWPENHPMFDTKIDMYPIGNLKNLHQLTIECNFSVTDEFLINLCKNAKKLEVLHIIGTNITDAGMSAINNLEELEIFDLGLGDCPFDRLKTNRFITDKSIECLFNKGLSVLDISHCINITDKGVIKLVDNLRGLSILFIKHINVTRETVKRIYETHNGSVQVHYTYKKGN